MACELVQCCQFFKDNMKELPKAAEYIQSKLYYGDYENCNRYKIYKKTSRENSPFDPNPDDQEAIKKAKQCMLKKLRSKEGKP